MCLVIKPHYTSLVTKRVQLIPIVITEYLSGVTPKLKMCPVSNSIHIILCSIRSHLVEAIVRAIAIAGKLFANVIRVYTAKQTVVDT